MDPQDYRIVKYVRASSVLEAISLAEGLPIHEVFLIESTPEGMASKRESKNDVTADAVGFKSIPEPLEDE